MRFEPKKIKEKTPILDFSDLPPKDTVILLNAIFEVRRLLNKEGLTVSLSSSKTNTSIVLQHGFSPRVNF